MRCSFDGGSLGSILPRDSGISDSGVEKDRGHGMDCLVLILNKVREQYRIANRAWNLQRPDQAFDIRPI
jgi:uncharacterized protein YijF (DUF1287 family)